MASVNKNTLSPGGVVVSSYVAKLTRGKSAQLGTIVAAGDVVTFTIPEPTYYNQAGLQIQCTGGTTPTCVLEFSLDGAAWATFPTVTTVGVVTVFALTGQPGGDPAATFSANYNVAGMGSGVTFRFGRTDAGGGNAVVFALVG